MISLRILASLDPEDMLLELEPMLRLDLELFITRRNLIDLRTSQVMRLLMVILVKINKSSTRVITMMISLRIPVSLDLEDIELELLPKDQIRSKLFKLVHKH
jgi:hypothetical protein